MRPLILTTGEERGLQRLLKLELTAQDFVVTTTDSPQWFLSTVESLRPELAIIDIGSEFDGLSLMLEALQMRSSLPVVLLAEKTSALDVVRGLDLGAADYIYKPLSPAELCARLRGILRRRVFSEDRDQVVHWGHLEIDLRRHKVKTADECLNLTPTEWELVEFLAKNIDKVVSQNEILTKVWGHDYAGDYPYLSVWMGRVRKKLGIQGTQKLIKTVREQGYYLDPGKS